MHRLTFITFLAIGALFFTGLKTSTGNVVVKFEGKPIRVTNPHLYVTLTEFFSDSLTLFLDSKKLTSGYFKTNESTAVAGTFVLGSQQLKTAKKVTIAVLSKGKTIERVSFNLKKGYSNVIINKKHNTWLILFTNREIEYE